MQARRHLSVLAVLATLTLLSTRASAGEGANDETSGAESAALTPDRPTQWYGYQTLATDGAALGLVALAKPGGDRFAVGGLVTYLAAAPVVHIAHGHGYKAIGDLALRAALPIAGALTGYLVDTSASSKNDWFAGYAGLFYGGLIGISSAVALDAIFLAREDAPRAHGDTTAARAAAPSADPARVRVLPVLAPSPAGMTAGVTGTF